ncbi:MAG: gliding motility-associated C-terminal domain-containing protein [Chitinophagaceae bacterium]|nr:gliding motility-associated C-terminal domain-containing protein [Chitinophagaceae bacterium]
MRKYQVRYCCIFFLSALLHLYGSAQSGFGPPVFKETFGVGNLNPSTVGTPIPAYKTQFAFDGVLCPAPGSYTILRRVPITNCFNAEWIDLGSDSDPMEDFGMMMLVNNNAGTGNRTVYKDTVHKTLCAGETYYFSAAVINLDLIDGTAACINGPDYPEFEMRIEDDLGNLIMKDTTARIVSYAAPPPMGYRFGTVGIYFTMPAGVNKLVLKMTSLFHAYECAEDFAVDDIQIRPVGPEVKIKFDFEPSTTILKSICFQDNTTVQLSGSMDPFYPVPALQWQQSTDNGATWVDIPGATGSVYSKTFSAPDTFLFRLSGTDASIIGNPNCRVVSNYMTVEVDGLPKNYTITNNSPVCAGNTLQFSAEGATRYIWTGPNGFYDNISYPSIYGTTLDDSGMYYVEVFSRGGCHLQDSTHVTIIGTNVKAWPDTAICKGESVLLQASAGVSYDWTPSNTLSSTNIINPRAKPETSTDYIVKVTDSYGCADTAHVYVRVLNEIPVKAVIQASDVLCRPSDSLLFTDKSLGVIASRRWDFGNSQTSSSANPSWQYYIIPNGQNSVVARLAVTDTAGCSDTAFHFINVEDNCYLAVPTAFTPNNDGRNDYLYPVNAWKVTDLIFRIYSRGGQLVFESRDRSGKWNGKVGSEEQPSGTYVWTLDYTDVSGRRISLKGLSTLIR